MKLALIACTTLGLALVQSGCLHWPGPMPGSHAPASTTDPEVIAAAQVACRERSVRLLTIREASRQIVAGTNYRLRLTVLDHGRVRKATAEVFCPLQGEASLTSWAWE